MAERRKFPRAATVPQSPSAKRQASLRPGAAPSQPAEAEPEPRAAQPDPGVASLQPLDVRNISTQGVHLIEASAGTGKTFTITSLILRLLVERGLTIDRILAVTFTNAATAELQDRIQARLLEALSVLDEVPLPKGRDPKSDPIYALLLERPDRERVRRVLAQAARDVDRAAVFTIHGFAARMLQEHPLQSGVPENAELDGDLRPLIEDVTTDFWVNRVATLPAEQFQAAGGAGLFATLLSVAQKVAGSFEVPVMPLSSSADFEQVSAELDACFDQTRTQFAAEVEEARERLLAACRAEQLKANQIKEQTVLAEEAAWHEYFDGGTPRWAPPGRRWTQSKLREAKRKNCSFPEHPLFVQLERLVESAALAKQAGERLADRLRVELAELVFERVRVESERRGSQSFDSLLTSLCLALRDPTRGPALAAEIRERLVVALIDEFQDTDSVQYEIFERIYQSEEARAQRPAVGLYLIGDPKQSIYAFRGADVFTYLQAARQATGGTLRLSTSYRSSPQVVAAQNALYARCSEPFGLSGIRYESIRPRPGAENVLVDAAGRVMPGLVLLEPASSGDPWGAPDLLQRTAAEVARFLRSGAQIAGEPVRPSHVAVLTRTNGQAQQMQALLGECGVAAVMYGDRSVFESDEAVQLCRVLVALAEPGRRALQSGALATELCGVRADELARLNEDFELLELWSERMERWSTLWRTRGISRALDALLSELAVGPRWLRAPGGERKMTNLRHLLELLHEAESTEHLGVFGLLRFFEAALEEEHGMTAEARQLRLESDAEAVTLTTAHKSKGLEYEVVFLPVLCKPDRPRSPAAYRCFDEDSGRSQLSVTAESAELTKERRQLEERQESLRLAYVALTRAKHHVVAAVEWGSAGFSSLGYLLFEALLPAEEGRPRPTVFANMNQEKKKVNAAARRQSVLDWAHHSGGAVAVQASLAEATMGSTQAASAPAREAAGEDGDSGQRAEGGVASLGMSLLAPPVVTLPEEHERTSSFSAMIRGASTSRTAREGRDRDEVDALLVEATGAGAAPPSAEQAQVRPTSAAPTSAAPPSAEQRVVLADFPRGAGPGEALHAIFENAPFELADRAPRREIIEQQLRRHRLLPEAADERAARLEQVERAVDEVLTTPFGVAGVCLEKVARGARFPELEFNLRVGGAGSAAQPVGAGHRLTAQQLGGVLGRHGFGSAVAESVGALTFRAFSGFLRGFIDLVYEFEGRLYALDYKSNDLGPHCEDYAQARLLSAMTEHHYLLQALLYSIALHRMGQQRVPAYSFDEHFGGMHYLFLRGMRPDRPDSGVFTFPATRALVEEASLLLDGRAEGGAP